MDVRDDLNPEIGYFVNRKCTPDWMLIEETINSIDIIYVLSGAATYMINNQSYHLTQGSLLCIPMGSVRSAYTYPDNLMECYSVSFQLFDYNGAEGFLPMPVISNIGIQPDIISMYSDLNSSWLRRNPGYKIKSRALLMLIILRYYELVLFKEHPMTIDTRINKAIKFITDNYHDNLTIEKVAEVTGLHPHYFGVLFKDSTGQSFRQFLTDIRINCAENLLIGGLHNITEVAVRCGFTDVCYFSRVYKKARGIPPSKAIHRAV
jgi:AraC-like DNA-binding protein